MTPQSVTPKLPTLRKTKPPKPGLTPLGEDRLRRHLRKSAPSEPWVDAQIKIFQDLSPDGNEIIYRFHDPNSFPPGGKSQTAMRYCRTCGRYTPPNSIHLIEKRSIRTARIVRATLQCDDCRIYDNDQRYHELYEAGLFLKPPSSNSFVRMADLHNLKNRK